MGAVGNRYLYRKKVKGHESYCPVRQSDFHEMVADRNCGCMVA
jgi:hypothetical protein